MSTEARDKAADELTTTRQTQLAAFGQLPSDYEGGFRDGAPGQKLNNEKGNE